MIVDQGCFQLSNNQDFFSEALDPLSDDNGNYILYVYIDWVFHAL